MPDDTPAPAAPALGFSITSNITDRSQIVVQSFVPLDATDEQINAVLDKVTKACDRQRAKYLVNDFKLKAQLEEQSLEAQKKTMEDRVAKLADLKNTYQAEWSTSNRRGEFRMTSQQETNISKVQTEIENMGKTVEAMKQNVERYKSNLAELEAQAK
jgi:hypothetical protein